MSEQQLPEHERGDITVFSSGYGSLETLIAHLRQQHRTNILYCPYRSNIVLNQASRELYARGKL
jgi:hypothetical protein